MYMISIIIPFLTFSVFASNVLFLVGFALFVFSEKSRGSIRRHFHKHTAEYTFFFAFLAAVGSLTLSNIIGFPPCELCWFQRIVLYPQVIIALVAWFRKETQFIFYCLPMSVIGLLISLYQSYIQWGGTHSLVGCTVAGGDCGKLYVDAYGYITIPFMALSVFIYMLAVSLL